MARPLMPNQRRSLDFASDQLTDGRRFRVLIADTSMSGVSVARELAAQIKGADRSRDEG